MVGAGTSLNWGRGRSDGGRSSPVQQPQEERATPPATVANIVRILSAFIVLLVWIVCVSMAGFFPEGKKKEEDKRVNQI